jgi:hypothetical protein
VDFAHVAVVYGGHLTVVPGDCDRVPTCSNDDAAISGIMAPAYPIALFEILRFGSGHVGLHWLGEGLAQGMWGAGIGFAKRWGSCGAKLSGKSALGNARERGYRPRGRLGEAKKRQGRCPA